MEHCLSCLDSFENGELKSKVLHVLNDSRKSFFVRGEADLWSLNQSWFGFLGVDFFQIPVTKTSKRGLTDGDYILTTAPKQKKSPKDSFDNDVNPGDLPTEVLLEKVKDSKLTSLQILISISILKTDNLESKLEDILDFVCENQEYLIGKDGIPKSTDPKRAILASLSKNASTNPLFVKGDEENTWKIGPNNVLYGCTSVPAGLIEYLTQSKSLNDNYELTELQKMIMVSIAMENGPCPLKKIYEFVKPQYNRLKRRDGSSYASNAKRAIQASLSNNSSNRPIFQMVDGPDEEDTYWALTERGEEQLETLRMGDSDTYSIFDE